jgi:diadenosine tetraphosphate (Ap4A) HIT family hydrolase
MPIQENKWMPREQWDALVNGKNCPLCAASQSNEQSDEYGHTIADMGISRLRLSANQFVAGYCVLICKKHVQEPWHLREEERALFFNDISLAAQAIEKVLSPIKMNLQILGNLIPHLHVHIIPRYYNDPAPGQPIDPDTQMVMLGSLEYNKRVRLIQKALKTIRLK